ncbi:YkvA family protein [Diaphorobacter nitroreducens]|uniref:YkvA family protein n=1 Tax=Diaphorobacter nitroreducens TaxID=164759 RepID=UPI0028A1DB62|nr:YkvA family protein [Diaphorobacter nitroreducens]
MVITSYIPAEKFSRAVEHPCQFWIGTRPFRLSVFGRRQQFAGKNPRTPWYAKALGVFVVAYALSPIDLIPDFIPVLGYLDDVLLLPGLIWVAIKLLPADVLAECRTQADEWMASKAAKPTSKVGAVVVVLLWLAACLGAWYWWKSGMTG